jgi:tellurite resistance protein
MKLRTAVFSALAAVVRADGVVTPEEREGLMEAARAAGVNEVEVARVIDGEAPTATEWMASLALTFEERVFVYAAAVWLAGIDGTVADEETAAVEKLGDALGLAENDRTIAALAASAFSQSAERGVLGLAHAITEHQNMNVT